MVLLENLAFDSRNQLRRRCEAPDKQPSHSRLQKIKFSPIKIKNRMFQLDECNILSSEIGAVKEL